MDANVDVLAYMELISNTGFPIVIAMYLLHRMGKKTRCTGRRDRRAEPGL